MSNLIKKDKEGFPIIRELPYGFVTVDSSGEFRKIISDRYGGYMFITITSDNRVLDRYPETAKWSFWDNGEKIKYYFREEEEAMIARCLL